MSLTTTEKLLIAMAYDQYGENKLDLIHNYLRCNNVDLKKADIEATLCKLKDESKINGYSNVLEYCEDKRYSKGIELYNKYKNILFDILENREVEWEVSSSEEESPIGLPQNKILKTTKKKDTPLNLISLGGLENVKFQNEAQMQIEPKIINKAISKNMKIDSSNNLKEKKRFYCKLSEEEKLIDDYFDILDERADFKQTVVVKKENQYYKAFPAAKNVRKEKDTPVLEIGDEKIKNEFETVLKKINSLKRQDKDKSLWRSEVKSLIEYITTLIGHKEDFNFILEKVEMSSLSQVIVLILLQLQDIVIYGEGEIVVTSGVLKKHAAAFYDFYKK